MNHRGTVIHLFQFWGLPSYFIEGLNGNIVSGKLGFAGQRGRRKILVLEVQPRSCLDGTLDVWCAYAHRSRGSRRGLLP